MFTKIAPGTVLGGRFEIQGAAGSGGMGVVYRAKDQATGAAVALKLLLTDDIQPLAAERFAREAKVLSELQHPGIVGHVAHGQLPDGRAFLAMDWLDGEELGRRLARGPLSLLHCMALLRQTTSALAAAHRRGIIHRDIKPSNIFLRDGQVERATLLDFGVARHLFAEMTLTGTGMLVGTPEYMAPEQARAERDIGAGADIFSLGCVLYQCLTGRAPFKAEQVAAVLAKILFEESRPVRDLRPSTPVELAALIDRMLRKDPKARPKDAIALQEELSGLPALPLDDEAQVTLAASIPPSALTGGEQVLVSVVIASPRAPMAAASEAAGAHGSLGGSLGHATMVRDLEGFGARVEWLADGSLVATLSRPMSSAADLVGVAARCALLVQERWPEAHVALATGRGMVSKHLPAMGEAIDRAVQLARRRVTPPLDAPSSVRSGVWLDDASSGLLTGRFVQSRADGSALLMSERVSVDESRLLLGKPTPCVGRELELGPLESLLSGSIEESVAHAVLITAPAGMGKSRLRHELVRRLGARYPAMKVLIGRGDPLSAGSPYGLLSQALRQRFGVQSGVALAEQQARIIGAMDPRVGSAEMRRVSERLGELCGVPFSDESSPPLRAARTDPKVMNDEIRQAFVDWLRSECAEAPVLLVLEDLHWGDPLTMKLMDAAMRELSDRPFMALALARPEVTDLFPKPWAWVAQEISLRPLSKKAGERLVREVLGADVGPEALARIVEQAEGNALYLEELIRAAAEGRRDEAPETLLMMLQARLLRLDPGARKVLRAASVFGEIFWSGGVGALLGGSDEEIAGWLRILVDAEIVEPRRESRFPGQIDHRFRHALLREAAYRLLTDGDRAAGHSIVSAYLERAGESDPMVIAEHAQRGGDAQRALGFYLRAAEQSWERNDVDGILARVERCIACGARDEALGAARALESLARFGKVDFAGADVAATEAVELLPPGGLWWCRAVEKLFIVLPHAGQIERLSALSQVFLKTDPSPEAGTAYVIAASYQLTMLALAGARHATTSFLAQLQTAGVRRAIERDPMARAWARHSHGWYVRALEPDPFLALTMARESDLAFEETGIPYYLTLSKLLLGITEAEVGELAGAEKMWRASFALATQLRDAYLLINIRMYFSLALSERSEPELRDEGCQMAETIIDANASTVYAGGAYAAVATVMLARGRAPEAEAAARRACALFSMMLPFMPMTLAVLIRALLLQGRAAEACASAEEGLRILTSLGGAGWSEIPLRTAVAEAWLAAGDADKAREALREALRQIELRSSKIPDPAWREKFLAGRPENVRAFALAREWLGQEGIEWAARLRGDVAIGPESPTAVPPPRPPATKDAQ